MQTEDMVIDLNNPTTEDEDILGGKALNLVKLMRLGMPVPPGIVIPHHISLTDETILKKIIDHDIFEQASKFAVRSSGVGEDSNQNSFAGIFDTYLDVGRDGIIDSIHKVRESAHSSRSKVYSAQRNSAVHAMNVVVQRMIPAKFAGVLFSRNPIENDKRIGLLEIVAGSGELLVSGKVTPTTVRYNKLTHQHTIKQDCTDSLNESEVNNILEQLLPLAKLIEKDYGQAVDIEWVLGTDNIMYILQARPITA